MICVVTGDGRMRLTVPDMFRDPYTFEGIISKYEEIINEVSEIDMSRVSFIEPYSMVSFLLMGRSCFRKRGEKIRLVNIPIHIHQYLARMDFFKADIFSVPSVLDETLFLKRSSESSRLIEITEIPNKERQGVNVITSVIARFRKRGAMILKYWMDDTVTDYFVTVISELCQNIFEHSLDTGFVSIQTYRSGKENIVRVVISDSGVGIHGSFESGRGIDYNSPADLIEKALTLPVSSKRDFGYGLCQVNSIVEKLRGTILLRSNNASLAALYNKKGGSSKHMFQRDGLPPFQGTQITISLTA